eukprot:TRINITY_DN931_c0_g2_i1.p1 TRINITY_DN931_c0_g2~~TRINITY_DN931_c0_g2_i1.p1  ORF type:complete len:305 (-),score=27.88 TRINITY_DN931_c0_g2_i1:1-915(-)
MEKTTAPVTSLFLEGVTHPIRQGGIYVNPWKKWGKSFIELLKWGGPKGKSLSVAVLNDVLPVLDPNMKLINSPQSGVIQATWIGHATFLVQFEGINFLTDPIWSERCSPFQWVGPKRFRPVPLSLKDLPPISFILISHNHHDHLDTTVVHYFKNKVTWIIPLGLGDWFRNQGVNNVIELGWWQKYEFPKSKISIIGAPAQHWSRRGLTDTNKSLWCSYCVLGPVSKVFFSCDTGYCPGFKEIGDNIGPFDLSLIPIGAYEPRWFMKDQHVDPEEAVQMHIDLKSKKSIGTVSYTHLTLPTIYSV